MWTNEEELKLRSLTLAPARHNRAELVALVQHFKSNGTLYSVTDIGEPIKASQEFARKIKRLTQASILDWLLSPSPEQDLETSQVSRGGPDLKILFDPSRPEDLGVKVLEEKPWQVACFRVENRGGASANACLARLILEKGSTTRGSQGPFELNAADVPYTTFGTKATSVRIPGASTRVWDMTIAPALSPGPHTVVSSGLFYSQRVEQGVRGVPPPEMDWSKRGICISTPITMTRRGVPQTHLLPGDYTARIEVADDTGHSVVADFSITAPRPGEPVKIGFLAG